jgi:exonuclease VII small subunit
MKYKSIEQETELCRKACKKSKIGDVMCFIHHEESIEILTELIENRIDYILRNKPEDEQAIRLHWLRPCPFELPERLTKAGAERDKAEAEYNKAWAEWQKALAEWDKAGAELDKARAEWDKAWAEWQKARAEYNKARAELDKAQAEYNKAGAEWQKAEAECKDEINAQFERYFPDCPWDGETLFPGR